MRALPPAAVAVGVVVGVLAISTAAILIRLADAPALALGFWRCAGGALVLAPLALRRAWRGGISLRGGEGGRLLASGLFLALHFALWISSLSLTTVASSVVLVVMSPLFVAVGAVVFLGEPPARRTWFGLILAMAGAAGVAAADFEGAAFGQRALLGNGLAFGGAAAVAGYLLLGRALRRRMPVSVYAAAVYTVAAVALGLGCVAAGVPLVGYEAGTWLAVVALVVGPQLLGHTVFNTLMSTVTATVVAVATLAEPVGATGLAWLVLGEVPVSGFWASAPLVLVGVYLAATRSSAGPRPAEP